MTEQRIRTDYFREYSRRNRAKKNAQAREYYAKDLDTSRAKKREAAKRLDRDKLRAKAVRLYYKNLDKNRELSRVRQSKARAKDPERLNAIARKSSHADLVGKLVRLSRLRAKAKGLPHNISREDVVVPARCPVLGIEFKFGEGVRMHAATPTLDRIKNSLGYVRGNVIVVSWRANRLKSDATAAELRAIADFYGALE